MDSAEDSEGEELELLRPGLIRELRNVLDEYPDDGQILKEMIQNAEDAGASCVTILADSRLYNREVDTRTLKKHPHLKFFQGPALCVYNNELFTLKDWEGIRRLHTSVKEKDPLKVGRFGLGFKSVFHLTDQLIIISGEFMMYMDPFKGADRYCSRKPLAGKKGRELESLLHCLGPMFLSASPHSPTAVFSPDVGFFSGTLFWFPLRRQKNELSDTLYTEKSLQDLLQAFRTEASSMLIFLKNLERIDLYVRDDQSTKPVFTVALSENCARVVKTERTKFKEGLQAASKDLPVAPLCCSSEVEVTLSDVQGHCEHKERWLVVNYHAGKGRTSSQLLSLWQDPGLCYQPYVGVAMPLGGQRDFQSHLFCFLPLPLDTKSPTGLPVHINGFFALSQNRRHIKWPTADQLLYGAHMEPSLQWNCLLVEELLPLAYLQLICRLREAYNRHPSKFYEAWPDVTRVDDRWKPLVRTLYRGLSQSAFFYTSVPADTWIPLSKAVLAQFPSSTEPDVGKAVINVYTINNESVIRPPSHVITALEQLSLLSIARTITPQHVSDLVINCHQQLSDADKLLLLQYLCSQGNERQLLLGQHLLPLQDGSFSVFIQPARGREVFWCEKHLYPLFPGLEKMMCRSQVSEVLRGHLKRLAGSGQFSLKILNETSSDVPGLLKMSLQKRFGLSSVRLSTQDSWIRHVWTFLQKTAPWNADMSNLHQSTLLPCLEHDQITLLPLQGIYVSVSAPGMSTLSEQLSSSLSKLGIRLLSLPPYVFDHKQVLGILVQYPTSNGILTALEQISRDHSLREKAESNFNTRASEAERNAMRKFLGEAQQLSLDRLTVLTGLQLFTERNSKRMVSVRDVSTIGPRDPLPVQSPRSLLECDEISRSVALKLGASETNLQAIVTEVLQYMQKKLYSDKGRKLFMKYFLRNSELMANQSLLALARKVEFIPTSSGALHTADDFYDSEKKVLTELFLGEHKFPCEEFAQSKLVSKLKKIGLRDETTMREDDLISAAQLIESLLTSGDKDTAARKAEGLWTLLVSHGDQLALRFNLSRLANVQCMPCLQNVHKPPDYPSSLPLQSDPAIVKPSQMVHYTDLTYFGSARATMRSDITRQVAEALKVGSESTSHDVLKHLLNVVHRYNTKEAPHYKVILYKIFKLLNTFSGDQNICRFLEKTSCVLAESTGCFACPKQFWVQKRPDDIDLSPYRFPLPSEMLDASSLFLRCRSSSVQDEQLLQDVLNEIKAKHEISTVPKLELNRDMRLVKQILDVLKESDAAKSGLVLVPISHKQPDVLQFRCAKDCTIATFANNEDGEFVFVHGQISTDTALKLGALHIKDRALTGIEDLDFGFGQHEELINRLHSLLKDSYTDGLSVPKELIQNADDAGATEVKFLLDERENADSRKNVINEMASLQGPALWAFNNATFSDRDFENIVRLGAGTKKEDGTMVGKFGLGFNSVYNLTDVPSFISRHTMAIFDPQVKYLQGPGLRLDFRKPINQSLLSRMPEQFRPFQGVFGCTLKKELEVQYKGTLFRFPFRTEAQATDSRIKAEAYSDSKRKLFLRMLLRNAGNLLMFTQNVNKLEIYYISSTCVNPAQAECLLTLNKDSNRKVLPAETVSLPCGVLRYATENWPTARQIRVKEEVTMRLKISHVAKRLSDVTPGDTEIQWLILWTCGTHVPGKSVRGQGCGQQVPLAAATVSLRNQCVAPLCESPLGFYKSGHIFCFLPLPNEFVSLDIPIHLNGTFELASSRRSLMMRTEDDLSGSEVDWNQTLFADAVCRAYLLLLENLPRHTASAVGYDQYFKLWPRTDGKNSLLRNFYLFLMNEDYKLFPDSRNGLWVSFSHVVFIDPEFRASDIGQIAWDALRQFWDKEQSLVHVPWDVHKEMNKIGHSRVLKEKIITERIFFEKVFFPNIRNSWWSKENRDSLTLHAVMHRDSSIQSLVKDSPCIPSLYTGNLKCPHELIHPDGQVAKLYLLSEGRFPQKGEVVGKQNIQTVNFSSAKCLSRLAELGMITDTLAWSMVVERAKSVENLARTNWSQAMDRTKALVDYMAGLENCGYRYDTCPRDVMHALSTTKFLPVMKKPDDWHLPWGGNCGDSLLESPSQLFSDNVKELAACFSKILDSEILKINIKLSLQTERVLNKMGLRTRPDVNDVTFLQLVTEQLTTTVHKFNENHELNKDFLENICNHIYKHLNTCTERKRKPELKQLVQAKLFGKNVIWVELRFECPSRVAFNSKYNCQPCLFQLASDLCRYRSFFVAVGVKDYFDMEDILEVFKELLHTYHGKKLPEETVNLMSRLAQLLCEVLAQTEPKRLEATSDLYLPDRHGFLQPVHLLCLDDCEWLRESDTMKFVHGKIAPAVARTLGVSSKRERDLDEMCDAIPFGQHERLTLRIKRLLEGYTFDSSVFKELIQNADDAGATEIKFLKDFRVHKTDRIPTGWEHLQGPALCVYNNKSFTSEDMEGIKNVGMGSKGHDSLKTGKYGVGFNAVYHITDVPSFWTREDNKQDVICVFDPNCQYLPNISPNSPGKKMKNISRLQENYPDMFAGYLGGLIDMASPGTLFRLPLRTDVMAQRSEIKNIQVTEEDVKKLLTEFQQEMAMCLLFLNNIKKLGVYTVDINGALTTDFEVTVGMHEEIYKQLVQYKVYLEHLSKCVKLKQLDLVNITPKEVCLQMMVKKSNSSAEQWIVVSRVGFCDSEQLSPLLRSVWKEEGFPLPRGGVAVRLSSTRAASEREEHLAFCCLPLPVRTGLPVHVNGEFILDHETRRNIWTSEKDGDGKTLWNKAIASQVIVPAYVTMIQKVRDTFFQKEDTRKRLSMGRLRLYEALFPPLNSSPSDFWKYVMETIYIQLARPELDILPVTAADHSAITWTSCVKDEGFPGYFNNLETYFTCYVTPKEAKQVVLTHGLNISGPAQVLIREWPVKKAGHLTKLLISLNMKITSMPFRIFEDFKSSGVAVREVTPDSVKEFLSSAVRGNTGDCNLTDLPKSVTDTSLKSSENVESLVTFLEETRDFRLELRGLPICLRQSQTLYFFQETSQRDKPILSKFGHLFPESSEHFLHKTLYNHFAPLLSTSLTVMRELDILTFADMLPHTLRSGHYKRGLPCEEDTVKPMPSKDWIKDSWTFFETLVTKPGLDLATEGRQLLDRLSEWSLIPVQWTSAGSDCLKLSETGLYPMKDIALVLNLTDTEDKTNAYLWRILSSLPLAKLDCSRLLTETFASKFVASISNPEALLHALNSLSHIPQMDRIAALEILRYFDNNLSVLRSSFRDDRKLIHRLRQLPFFSSIDGKLQSLHENTSVISVDHYYLPPEGLCEWSERTNRLIMLKQHVPEQLAAYLNFKTSSITIFYTCYLLPEVQLLPRHAITIHIEFLKDKLQSFQHCKNSECDDLISQLKKTPFIEGSDGHLHTANNFYSPHNLVFKAMCSPEDFPPEPYSKREWKNFMDKVGIISSVTADMFIGFAKTLAAKGRNGLNQELEESSLTLVNCLFHSMDLKSGYLLSVVKGIPFLVPSKWTRDKTKKVLTGIASPFCAERFVSFSECCLERHLYLVWSSSAILSPAVDVYFPHVNDNDKRQLGIAERPPVSKVVQHVRNVCGALAERDHILQKLGENKDLLKQIMVQVYEYLITSIEEIPLPTLQTLPIIYHVTANQMMCPDNIVIDMTKDDEIDGFLMIAPHEFGNFFDLFKKLGVAESVTADHYARVLHEMKSCTGDKQLHVEEMKKVRQAVEGLFKCLKSTSPKLRCLSLGDLYLPSEEEVLRKSSELIFVDNDLLRVRLSTPPAGKSFFVGFNKLEIKHLTAGNIKQLPERYGMVLLTSVVTETVPQHLTELAVSSQAARMLNDKVSHPMVAEAVARAMFNKCSDTNEPFPDNAVEQIAENLSRISVREIQGLQTVLMVNGEIISGSDETTPSFVCKQGHEHRSCTVFIDVSVCNLRDESYIKEFTSEMAIAMAFVLGFDSMWFEHIVDDARGAMKKMDKQRLLPLNAKWLVLRSVFPQAGTFVPVSLHCYLDNSFYRFKEGEHVGFELYDPCVEMDDPEDTTPVYIYGIILKEAEDKQEEESLLTPKYLVDLGPERGQMEILATRLYKFIRKSDQSGVLSEARGPVHEPSPPQDLKAVLREIRRLLTEASELPDPERRRVAKRLILKWHPDKNPGNEKFCTEVMQALNRYIDLLRQGKTLNVDEDEDEERPSYSRPSQSPFSSPFFEHMYRRGASHKTDFDSHQQQHNNTFGNEYYSERFYEGTYRGTSNSYRRSNPQPGEGRRWFRQAEADLLSARETNGMCKRGYNWVCFQCHQAVEKALKAVLYCRDADACLFNSHDLSSLAGQVHDPDLSELASTMNSLLGPHTQMRYPDAVLSPSIPADVYNDHKATKACGLAAQVLSKAKTFL